MDEALDTTKVMVEGHCDSRGTSEYNLALGDRRAKAVQDYLVSLGIARQPRRRSSARARNSRSAPTRTRACWQQNRRGHFMITAK